jgi:diguanylate cyclase (GGDEF)-like protein
MPTFPTFDGGQRMCSNGQPCTTQISKTRGQDSARDSESQVVEELSLPNLARFFSFALEEKQSSDQSFQTLLSESNQELATLLREVRASSDTVLESARQTQPGSNLLMRAVRCAVKQHMLQVDLSDMALTDELTGLYNRRGFFYLTERQLKLAGRSRRDMLLFFIDVDGLKRINDSFGHSEGDLSLIRTANALLKTFRDTDVVARLGGDEFAALAIQASDHSEATIVARLREHLELVNAREPSYRLSVSFGTARFVPGVTDSIAKLILEADRTMYRARRNQRMPMGQSRVNGCQEESMASPTPIP